MIPRSQDTDGYPNHCRKPRPGLAVPSPARLAQGRPPNLRALPPSTQETAMTATRSERGLDDGEVAREFADAEVLANSLEYFLAGRYAEAEAAYASILAHEPDHFICLHHLGLIAHARGEHAAAARLIEQAISIKPDYIDALSNLA